MGNTGTVPTLTVGARRIKIRTLLAEGGYGCVYKAEDDNTQDVYAFKLMRIPLDEAGNVSDQEAMNVASMEQNVLRMLCPHPNIVHVFESGVQRDATDLRYYTLFEFCPRSVLGMLMDSKQNGQLMPEGDIMSILRDTLLALQHMHNFSPPVAYRDLKVENLLFGADGKCKLCDFGSCSNRHRTLHTERDVAAAKEEIRRTTTPAYRAPEQVDVLVGSTISEKVDVWAVGVLIFQLAFFRTPFEDVRGDVQNLKILEGFTPAMVPSPCPYSKGLVNIVQACLTLNQASRPSVSDLLKLCDDLREAGKLPYWPQAASLPVGVPNLLHFSSDSTVGGRTEDERRAMTRSPDSTSGRSDRGDRHSSSPPTSKGRGSKGGTSPGSLWPSGGAKSSQHTPASSSLGWMDRLGEGVISKWYKLGGGEQQKRLWVLKTTSRAACGPKAKYIRKVVAALWENDLTLGEFFQLLRYRPLADSPIVALKALITLLRVLQQGPPQCLVECSTYADVVEEIGQMWTGSDLGEGPDMLPVVISRLASSIVEKVRFHQHHPEYGHYFASPIELAAAVTDQELAVTKADGSRAVNVLKCLLGMQDRLMATQRQTFLVLARGSLDAQNSVRSTLLPIVEESCLTFLATTRMLRLMTAAKKKKGDAGNAMLISITQSYQDQLSTLREFFTRASSIEELQLLGRTVTLPPGNPLDEACGSQMYHHFTRAKSKVEATTRIRSEEHLNDMQLNKRSSSSFGDEDDDNDVSDDDEEEMVELGNETGFSYGGGDYQEQQDWAQLPPPAHAPQNAVGQDMSAAGGNGDRSTQRARTSQTSQQLLIQTEEGDSPSESPSAMPAPPPKPQMTQGLSSEFDTVQIHEYPGSAATQNQHGSTRPPPLPPRRQSLEGRSSTSQSPGLPPRREMAGVEPTPPRLPRRVDGHEGQNSDSVQQQRGSEGELVVPPQGDLIDLSPAVNDVSATEKPVAAPVITGERKGSSEKPVPHPVPSPVPVLEPQAQQQQPAANASRPAAGGAGRPSSGAKDGPPAPGRPAAPHRIAVALCDYRAQGPDQISFRHKDIIKLHSTRVHGKGWGFGEANGKVGWFPSDFVRIQAPDAANRPQRPQPPVRINGPTPPPAPVDVPSDMLPEHHFAVSMARAEPWKDRLTPGGKQAYADLVSFFNASGMVIDYNQIALRGVIGSGAFATVFRATYTGRDVAVKKLVGGGGGPMEKTLKDFKTEAALLSRLRHKHIITVVGATVDPITIVMDYCSRGNLMVLLNDASITLSWPMKKEICLGVALGMQYLHSQNPVIIHRDLKSLNVLIDEKWVTKVTDFGLSRFKATSETEKMTGQAGTYHWMAPEVINSQHYTEKADVFSFGIILWEVATRSIPYNGMQPVQVVAAVLGRRERPIIPRSCVLASLMTRCWAHESNSRPSFDEIVPWLQGLP